MFLLLLASPFMFPSLIYSYIHLVMHSFLPSFIAHSFINPSVHSFICLVVLETAKNCGSLKMADADLLQLNYFFYLQSRSMKIRIFI